MATLEKQFKELNKKIERFRKLIETVQFQKHLKKEYHPYHVALELQKAQKELEMIRREHVKIVFQPKEPT